MCYGENECVMERTCVLCREHVCYGKNVCVIVRTCLVWEERVLLLL